MRQGTVGPRGAELDVVIDPSGVGARQRRLDRAGQAGRVVDERDDPRYPLHELARVGPGPDDRSASQRDPRVDRPRGPVLGWTVTRPEANSNYDTVVVVGEYDPTADFPDRPWNILALINSLFGFQSSHGPSALSSPTEVPEENIRETENDKGATTTTYLVPRPVLPMLEPLDGVLPPPVISAANNVLKPIVDRGYSRNDATNGNRAPYLQPTNGLPRLVMPTRVTHSFKATPNVSGLPRLDSALSALDRSTAPKSSPLARVRERSANRLQRLNNLTDSWHPGRNPDPAVAEALS